jgi:phosphoribosylglycinamide formyltransferase-1
VSGASLVNLTVDLRDPQFDGSAFARALRAIETAGFTLERPVGAPPEPYLSWIDDEFGGFWSSEARAGCNLIARSQECFAGFAAFDVRDRPYFWLRGVARERGVGIFGPFGVAQEFRGGALGGLLLTAALGALRAQGYDRALIPAVGGDRLIQYYVTRAGAAVCERFERSALLERRYRTVVMASGNGSNFQSVIDGVAAGRLPLDLAALVSNRSDAYALERARAAGVPAIALVWDRRAQHRAEYDLALFEAIHREQPELLLLLGWMHMLDERFVAGFPDILNIHPAFLPLEPASDETAFPDGSVTPAFRGAHAVRDALAWGAAWVGASAHGITLEADRGPVFARKPLRVHSGEPQERVMERLHPLEHRVLASGILRWVYER